MVTTWSMRVSCCTPMRWAHRSWNYVPDVGLPLVRCQEHQFVQVGRKVARIMGVPERTAIHSPPKRPCRSKARTAKELLLDRFLCMRPLEGLGAILGLGPQPGQALRGSACTTVRCRYPLFLQQDKERSNSGPWSGSREGKAAAVGSWTLILLVPRAPPSWATRSSRSTPRAMGVTWFC